MKDIEKEKLRQREKWHNYYLKNKDNPIYRERRKLIYAKREKTEKRKAYRRDLMRIQKYKDINKKRFINNYQTYINKYGSAYIEKLFYLIFGRTEDVVYLMESRKKMKQIRKLLKGESI